MSCEIHITRDDLIKLDACSDGVEVFDHEFPDGMHGIWDKTAQLLLMASPLRSYFGWACEVRLLPRWSLSGSNLSGSDLSGSDLSGSNLRWSDLRGSNLRALHNICLADLTGAYRFISDAVIDGWELIDGRLQRVKVSEHVGST